MEKFPIFILNHPYLFSLLFVILTLLIWNIFGNLIGGVRLLTTDEATQLINREGAEVIDIRSKTDFEKGHIINAKNIGLQELPEKINKLRVSLIKEELGELIEAINNSDLKEVADALTDILYVTYGAGHAFGINLDKCFDEVQESNMSKLGTDGKPIYNEAGKVMKGPNYFKPDLSKFLK